MLCSYPAQAVYQQLLIGVYANQVPGLAEVGAAALAEKMCKPLQSVVDALDELVVADLAEVDAEASLIRLPGVPEDHSHVAVGANNVVGWLKIVKDLSRQESGLLRRHVDELVDVIHSAISEHSPEGPGSQKLLAAVASLAVYGTRPNPVRTPSEPRPNPIRTNDTEPETETETETETDTEPDAAVASERASEPSAVRVLTHLAAIHPPTADPSQRWKPKNRAHLAAAEALLATDGDPGWPDEVIDLVTDFSAICAQNREEAKFWLAPRMLDTIPSPQSKSGKSRWETIVSVVGSWRAERRVQEQEAHQRREQARAAERQRVEDRLVELEGLARNGEPAFARQLRESGQKSTPVVDYKACLSAAQEAVADARRGGRDPTLEEIERAVGAVQNQPKDSR